MTQCHFTVTDRTARLFNQALRPLLQRRWTCRSRVHLQPRPRQQELHRQQRRSQMKASRNEVTLQAVTGSESIAVTCLIGEDCEENFTGQFKALLRHNVFRCGKIRALFLHTEDCKQPSGEMLASKNFINLGELGKHMLLNTVFNAFKLTFIFGERSALAQELEATQALFHLPSGSTLCELFMLHGIDFF